MPDALVVLKEAIAGWWAELIQLTVLNVLWLFCQMIVIPGPPATATLYAVTRRLAEGEFVTARDVWSDFKGVFWRAWQWGLANLALFVVALGNFYAYRGYSGLGWGLLKLLWGGVLLIWLLIQVFYWPFFFEQEDRSFRTTLGNAARLLLANPGFGLFIGLFSLALTVAGMLSGFPLGFALMAWLALIGTHAVRSRLAIYREREGRR